MATESATLPRDSRPAASWLAESRPPDSNARAGPETRPTMAPVRSCIKDPGLARISCRCKAPRGRPRREPRRLLPSGLQPRGRGPRGCRPLGRSRRGSRRGRPLGALQRQAIRARPGSLIQERTGAMVGLVSGPARAFESGGRLSANHEAAGRESRGSVALSVAIACAPIVVVWVATVLVHPRPFWVHFYDPELAYLGSGLRLLAGEAPHHVDHPGAPVQLLSALILLATGKGPE